MPQSPRLPVCSSTGHVRNGVAPPTACAAGSWGLVEGRQACCAGSSAA
ncbi:hypothetical protein [Priestia megaterium]